MTVWLDPADDVQGSILREIEALPPSSRGNYLSDLVIRGYRSDADWIYRTVIRVLKDYMAQITIPAISCVPIRQSVPITSTQQISNTPPNKPLCSSPNNSPRNTSNSSNHIPQQTANTQQYSQPPAEDIPENMLRFLCSLQEEGENS